MICQKILGQKWHKFWRNFFSKPYLAKYQEAIKYNQQSLAIFKEIGDGHGEACSYKNLGNAYYFLGQYEQAREYYQQSLAIFKEIGDKPGEAKALFNVDLCFKKVQWKDEAKESFHNAR